MNPSPYETIYIKTLNGFDFENLCAKIIEKLGWGEVTHTEKTNDGGKDLIIRSQNSEIIYVECKHWLTNRVGRPVVQKLHSAIITSNAFKGIIMTTSSFTKEAIDYARNLTPPVELIDLLTLTEMAQNIGIKLISEEKVADCFYELYAPDSVLEKIQYSLLSDVKTYPRKIEDLIKFETLQKAFLPIYIITYSIHESFSTTVRNLGSVHADNESLAINGSTRRLAEESILSFINSNPSKLSNISELQESARDIETINKSIDLVSLNDLAKQIIIENYTLKISYVGRNNIKYKKTFYPHQSSVSLKDIQIVDLRYRKIRINQGIHSKEVTSIDSENEILLDHAFPSCDYCGGKKRLMVCDSCVSIFDYGLLKHGRKCSMCSMTICVNCLYKYKWPSFFRGYICKECSLKLYNKELSEKRKTKKIIRPNYWDMIKNDNTFKV